MHVCQSDSRSSSWIIFSLICIFTHALIHSLMHTYERKVCARLFLGFLISIRITLFFFVTIDRFSSKPFTSSMLFSVSMLINLHPHEAHLSYMVLQMMASLLPLTICIMRHTVPTVAITHMHSVIPFIFIFFPFPVCNVQICGYGPPRRGKKTIPSIVSAWLAMEIGPSVCPFSGNLIEILTTTCSIYGQINYRRIYISYKCDRNSSIL